MAFLKQTDEKYADSTLWQFIKFNLVSLSVGIVQLILANILPFVFDRIVQPLPAFLRGVFDPSVLFAGPTRYVIDGVVTWGYVIPFFLSNLLANLFGYFVNMRATFRGKGTRAGLALYVGILMLLILFSTWLQGLITARLTGTSIAALSRTIAAMAAGLVQMAVLFPLEKYVLFREKGPKNTETGEEST